MTDLLSNYISANDIIDAVIDNKIGQLPEALGDVVVYLDVSEHAYKDLDMRIKQLVDAWQYQYKITFQHDLRIHNETLLRWS